MPKFITRTITKPLIAQQSKFLILDITGPGRSGKTTLLKHLFKDYTYVSLENVQNIRCWAGQILINDLSSFDAWLRRLVVIDSEVKIVYEQ